MCIRDRLLVLCSHCLSSTCKEYSWGTWSPKCSQLDFHVLSLALWLYSSGHTQGHLRIVSMCGQPVDIKKTKKELPMHAYNMPVIKFTASKGLLSVNTVQHTYFLLFYVLHKTLTWGSHKASTGRHSTVVVGHLVSVDQFLLFTWNHHILQHDHQFTAIGLVQRQHERKLSISYQVVLVCNGSTHEHTLKPRNIALRGWGERTCKRL